MDDMEALHDNGDDQKSGDAGNEANQNANDPPQKQNDGDDQKSGDAGSAAGSKQKSANGNGDAGDRGRSGSFDGSESNARRRSNEREKNDNRDANPETFTQIYIAGIKRETGEDELREGFSKFGDIESVTVREHYAFIKFIENKAA